MSIAIQRISYVHADKDCLFSNISLSINKGDKIGLVGKNGSGKSTLMQIIAGKRTPTSGTISLPASGIYYVPQHFGQYDHLTIAQALGVEDKINALHAILDGKVDDLYFSTLNEDWNIEERTQAALSFWGLEDFSLKHPMNQLSGGEKTKVFLAGIKIHEEAFILLDEPTNHLDYFYREKFYNFIQSFRGSLLVVSHDRTLLNLLPVTYELQENGITVYGGNYDFYKEQKTIESQALLQQLEEKEKQLRLAKKTAREAMERQQKHDVRGEKQNQKKGVARIVMGNLKSQAEKSTAKLKGIHADKTESIQDELRKLRSSAPSPSSLKTDFNSSSLHTGKILIDAQNINFGYNEEKLWKNPLNIEIRSGQRIAIKGRNGSGKTTLLKLITGELEPQDGTIFRADHLSYVYLDQEYSIIRNERTILEQAEAFNRIPLPEHELKTILNRFLFPAAVWDKPCEKLSGGEKMRLSFCCLMINNNTPDLFILDEPTNNLDIQSIEIIADTIKRYSGTVLVISHDKQFLEDIGINNENPENMIAID